MPRASAWYRNNDMVVELEGFASSTASTSYINNSTGLTVSIWNSPTTASSTNRLVNGAAMSYVSAGLYRYTAQSTAVTPTLGNKGMAIIVADHAGLDGEWRVPFLVQWRGTT